jgi:heme O synthase-like polyprenyltransferase
MIPTTFNSSMDIMCIKMRPFVRNAGKRLKVIGSYLLLAGLVFTVVALFAGFEEFGNWFYLVAGLLVLALFLLLCLQVHYRHRGTMYGLEDFR